MMVVWWTPVFLLMALGGYDILVQVGNFFSPLAVVTFGGAPAFPAHDRRLVDAQRIGQLLLRQAQLSARLRNSP